MLDVAERRESGPQAVKVGGTLEATLDRWVRARDIPLVRRERCLLERHGDVGTVTGIQEMLGYIDVTIERFRSSVT